MAIEIDKTLIKQRFAKSIDTYDSNAPVQLSIAKYLAQLISGVGEQYHEVLELGAGTGMLTSEMLKSLRITKLLCNDLVLEYKPKLDNIVSVYNVDFTFVESDLEEIEHFPGTYDLISSASTLQWIIELDELFNKLDSKLNAGGVLAFSSFGSNNLFEVRDVMQSGLYYAGLYEVSDIVARYFTVDRSEQQEQTLYFKEPIDVLKHLKYTGVNALFKARWTKKDLEAFSNKYREKFSCEKGVKLTYHPLYIIAKKK